MEKTIFGFVIGIVLCSGIVYAATIYKASDVSYANDGWEVNNVNEALDSLYVNSLNSNAQLVEVGTSRNFNIKDIVGEKYIKDYAANDFIVVGSIPTTKTYGETRDLTDAKGYASISETTNFTVSYNDETGDVTINGGTITVTTGVIKSSGSSSGSLSSTVTKDVKVYMLIKTPNANI